MTANASERFSLSHIGVSVCDFEDAARRLWDEHGLRALEWGVWEDGSGLATWVVPLGGVQYLTLTGVVDPEAAINDIYGSAVIDRTAEGDRLDLWALETSSIATAAARIGRETETIALVDASDGTRLEGHWLWDERERMLPELVEWVDEAAVHRRVAELVRRAEHRVVPAGIAQISLSGDAAELHRWLAGAESGLPVAVAAGPPGVRSVTIATAAGPIVLQDAALERGR